MMGVNVLHSHGHKHKTGKGETRFACAFYDGLLKSLMLNAFPATMRALCRSLLSRRKQLVRHPGLRVNGLVRYIYTECTGP